MTASANPPLGDDELVIEREFDAPVALVFRLWEGRDHMIRWWGPEMFTVLDIDWEAKPGRRWRCTMVSKQFGISKMGGIVREVQKNQRLVFSFKWDRSSGEDIDTLVTVTFETRNGKTIQRFHQTPFASVAARDNHVGGWNSLFNRQQAYVENIAVAEEKGFNT